jgi:hypothetical protein
LIIQAIKLRIKPITDDEYYHRARQLKEKIIKVIKSPANHSGIRRIQDIFYENSHRLYHWVDDRSVPADNNFAERQLRRTVIARKVSFGSQSEKGAKTREILMTLLHTLDQCTDDPAERLKEALDQLAIDQSLDPYELLFGSQHTISKDKPEQPSSLHGEIMNKPEKHHRPADKYLIALEWYP